jgi:uncharacterized protein with LGFP repeats/GH25 family lysozyme M1 (1,4-beta-N-acetylmuramidase)
MRGLRLAVHGIMVAALVVGLTPQVTAPAAAAPAPITNPDADYLGSSLPTHEPSAVAKGPRGFAALDVAGVHGVDVSHWQGTVDWNGLAAGGNQWAYIKATEGDNYLDPQFQTNFFTGSYNAGVIRGSYHFALPDRSSGAAQANFFADHGGVWSADGKTLPPVLDIEYNKYGDWCYNLSWGQMVSWIADFVNTMRARTGRTPVIYTTKHWWNLCTGNAWDFGLNSPLWIAGFHGDPMALPHGWPGWTMWQYASDPLDQDLFNGTIDELRALATGNDDDAVGTHYNKLGGASYLGTPTGARYAIGGGSAQDYTNGSIYLAPGTRAWSVRGDLLTRYRELGGPGVLGFPGNDESATMGGAGRMNYFQAGSIYSVPGIGVHEVHGAIREQWGSLGWEGSALGYPITDEAGAPDGLGRFSDFQGGSIYWSPATGAFDVRGDIKGRWTSLGSVRSFLGYPTTNETSRDGGAGAFNHFQGGSLYWSPGTGARYVVNGIRSVYLGWDAERGFLGYPTTDETSRDNVGVFNHFQFGSVFWSPGSGIHYVVNGIRAKYASYDYERSFFGYPTSDETSRDNVGTFSHFQGGSIYWSPGSGIHYVVNGIRAVYLGWDAERGFLGYPISDESSRDNVGVFNHFQYGSIFWSPAGGTHYVANAIRARYLALNAELSYLGYPTSNEYGIPGGARTDFQHGTITWNAATGEVTDRPY